MKITKLTLASFRSFVNVSLPTDAPRVLVVGTNNTGKSSILQAIKYILTGRCQGLDGKGSGAELLIPFLPQNGHKPARSVEASLDLAGVGTITRGWSPSQTGLRVQGWTGTSGTQQQALYDRLHTTPTALDAVLDTDLFARLHHAEAKALMLALLDVKIRLTPEDEKVYTLDELDGLYHNAFEDRKLAKRKLAGMPVPTAPSSEPCPTVEAIDAQLEKLRGTLLEQAKETGAVAADRKRLTRDFEAVQHDLPVPELGEDSIEDLEERLALIEADLSEANQSVEAVPLAFHYSPDDIAKHVPSDGCVMDRSIPCDTAKKVFKAKGKALQEQVVHNATTAKFLTAKVEAGQYRPGDVFPIDSPLTVARKRLTEAKRLKDNHDQAVALNDIRKVARQQLKAEIDALPDTSAQDEAVAELNKRIAKGEALRRTAEAHWRALETFDEATQARQAVVDEIARLDALCDALGPSGLRVQALGAAMDRFEHAVNEVTAPFALTVKFVLEPWGVSVNDRPLETYSRSEQYRIGVAVQLAIAQISGLNFAVVDELDLLDGPKRQLLGGLLHQSSLEQIFVLQTKDQAMPLPKIPGWLAYRIDIAEGQSQPIEQVVG